MCEGGKPPRQTRIAEKARDRERATVAAGLAAIAGPPTPAKHPSPRPPDSEALLPLGEQTRTGPYRSWSSSHPFMTDQQTSFRQRRDKRCHRRRCRIPAQKIRHSPRRRPRTIAALPARFPTTGRMHHTGTTTGNRLREAVFRQKAEQELPAMVREEHGTRLREERPAHQSPEPRPPCLPCTPRTRQHGCMKTRSSASPPSFEHLRLDPSRRFGDGAADLGH